MPTNTNLSIMGEREQGQDVRTNNVTAVQALANIVKSSLGPQGLDKMLVDDIGDVTITNDGATILKQLEVEHPAAKVIVELAQLQDKEVGDGTTSVVVIAAELLKRANDLIKNKLHPTNIIAGYKIAARKACEFIEKNLAVNVDTLGSDALMNVAKTSMSSKLIGPESELFSKMVVEAMLAVKTIGGNGEFKYPLKSVKIAKCHGQSSLESRMIPGYAIQMSRVSQQMPQRVKGAKIACLDMNLNKFKCQMGVMVLVDDPKNLEKIRQRECDILKERCEKIIKSGANVVITTKGIDDIAAKYFVEAGVFALRRVEKNDLRRIAKSTGATVITTFANTEKDGDETFDAALLGTAEEVYEETVGDNDFSFVYGFKQTRAVTILLRGANEYLLDEVERSVHDSLCVVKRCLESGSVVAGGGAVEIALNIYLEDFARSLGSKEQLAIAEFAEALTVIPKILATNAAQDASELVSKLRVAHAKAQQTDDEKYQQLKHCGLDLVNGKIRNNLQAGVLEPAISKVKSIKFATEAAITILRIDDMIKLEARQEEMPGRH
jgi:T-complex protein 1 subunit alpha